MQKNNKAIHLYIRHNICDINLINYEVIMMKKARSNDFIKQLKKYISIKGLEIVIHLVNGEVIELQNNVRLEKNNIIVRNKNREFHIPISDIKSIDLYAA